VLNNCTGYNRCNDQFNNITTNHNRKNIHFIKQFRSFKKSLPRSTIIILIIRYDIDITLYGNRNVMYK